MTVFLVGIGGAAGAILRYLVGVAVLRLAGAGFPWGTMVVNVAGSFAMGVLAVVLFSRTGFHGRLSALMMTGFLGGFTTFSAFSLDAYYLFERDRLTDAALYVGGSVILSILALASGLAAARWLT
jgi:CrcB protein